MQNQILSTSNQSECLLLPQYAMEPKRKHQRRQLQVNCKGYQLAPFLKLRYSALFTQQNPSASDATCRHASSATRSFFRSSEPSSCRESLIGL